MFNSSGFKSNHILLALTAMLLMACDTTSSIPYKASTENVINMQSKIADGSKVGISSVTFAPGAQSSMLCRAMGDLDVGAGKTVPDYIKSAFQEELFMAQRYDPNSKTQLTIEIQELSFSTISPAYWDIGLKMSPSNPNGYSVRVRHNFKTSFSAWGACKNAVAAFGGAVQSVIQEVVNHPNFTRLGDT